MKGGGAVNPILGIYRKDIKMVAYFMALMPFILCSNAIGNLINKKRAPLFSVGQKKRWNFLTFGEPQPPPSPPKKFENSAIFFFYLIKLGKG